MVFEFVGMRAVRKIVHVDMDAFYASVEQRDNPCLKGKPVVVGGKPNSRGVVAAASYEARKFGIRSAMSCRKAYQLCRSAVFVPPNFGKYKEASQKVFRIFREVTDLVEPLSLDEAYLDVTENHLNEESATKIARYLRARIKGQTQLTASAGVAPNKFLAKIASELNKPDGLYVVTPTAVDSFVENLPVERLWGVGPATAKKLHQLGWHSTRDIRSTPLAVLEKSLGKYAAFLKNLSHGKDERTVSPFRELKSRGSETTFSKDVLDKKVLEKHLERFSKNLLPPLLTKGKKPYTATLKLRYHDFSTITRSTTSPTPIEEVLELNDIANRLLNEKTDAGLKPVRLIGLSLSNFLDSQDPEQLSFDLFEKS